LVGGADASQKGFGDLIPAKFEKRLAIGKNLIALKVENQK